MTISHSSIRAFLMAALAIGLLGVLPPSAHAAQSKTHAAKKKESEPPKPVGEVVPYEALEERVGQDVVIETTFNTERRGTLIKYTKPTLTIKITPEAGGFELTVPRETIKKITVLPPPAVLDKDEGKSGAEKK
jgi:hypothetical protein